MDMQELVSFPQFVVDDMLSRHETRVTLQEAVEGAMHNLGHLSEPVSFLRVHVGYPEHSHVVTVEWVLRERSYWAHLCDILEEMYRKQEQLEQALGEVARKLFDNE